MEADFLNEYLKIIIFMELCRKLHADIVPVTIFCPKHRGWLKMQKMHQNRTFREGLPYRFHIEVQRSYTVLILNTDKYQI